MAVRFDDKIHQSGGPRVKALPPLFLCSFADGYFTYTGILALAPEPPPPPCLPREEWLAAAQGVLGERCYRLAGTRPLFSLQRLFALGGGASLCSEPTLPPGQSTYKVLDFFVELVGKANKINVLERR